MRPVGLAIATSIGLGFANAPTSGLEIPRGKVELVSLGTVDLTVDRVVTIHALHVRMVVSNTADDRPWTLDAATSQLELGSGRVAATFANSDVDTLPLATVARGQRAMVDLYFALPDRTRDPTEFAVDWTLRTPDSSEPQRTRFSVEETQASRARTALPAGWGGRWWFDRAYPWPSFYRDSGILAPRPPTQVSVVRRSHEVSASLRE